MARRLAPEVTGAPLPSETLAKDVTDQIEAMIRYVVDVPGGLAEFKADIPYGEGEPRALEEPEGTSGGCLSGPLQMQAALRLLQPFIAGRLHRARVTASFDALVEQMMPSLAEIDPVPYAVVRQAQRRAALRTQLLATGAFTYRALAEGRGTSSANIRQWARRARERHELFTVDHDNETLIPALLLDEELSPRPEFKLVIAPLVEAGEDGWGLWAWLVNPSPWLDGAVPAAELFRRPEVVVEAARARAAA
jgi:hypothetical protein